MSNRHHRAGPISQGKGDGAALPYSTARRSADVVKGFRHRRNRITPKDKVRGTREGGGEAQGGHGMMSTTGLSEITA